MGQVSIQVNGRNYDIACDDGEEEHVLRLGRYIDGKLAELVAQMGQVGDSRLLVMAALLIADELSDAYGKLEKTRTGAEIDVSEVNGEAAHGISVLAERIDDIAAGLERA
ncbi:MAG TPA: cell division protein ZapA [Alphaproteobacteria bacterium]|nr:cell division protein ZapA [Alphaproteobacteria bacterium]